MNFQTNTYLVLLLIWAIQPSLAAQTVTRISLPLCQEWARENYPLTRNFQLIDQARRYNMANAANGYLPQLSLNGQASYQSAVTEIPIDLPNLPIPEISKDQYRVSADVFLPLTNGPQIANHRKQLANRAEIEKQDLEIQLRQLEDRIQQIYFGILILDARAGQLTLLQEDIDHALEKTRAAVANGTAAEVNTQLLEAEQLKAEQRVTENQLHRQAFIDMLSQLTGQGLNQETRLETPATPAYANDIERPELTLFTLQNNTLDLQDRQIGHMKIPVLGLFMQGGYGRPALNMLSNDFDPYVIGGVRLNWNLGWMYSAKNDRDLITVNRQKVLHQRDAFLLNTQLELTQQDSEIRKYERLIEQDQALIELRSSIRLVAEAQLENGLISALDYISYLNAENAARQDRAIHELQQLQAACDRAFISGLK